MSKPVFYILTYILAVTLSVVSPAWADEEGHKGSLGEGKHMHYVPPVSNPFLNETPFITTEAKLITIYNNFPNNILALGGPGGGHIQIIAGQFRFALTDRLGIIVNKIGYANLNHENSFFSDDGLLNISLGIKYVLLSDIEKKSIATLGVTYEIPSGTLQSGVTNTFRLQGDGRGFLNTFLSIAENYDKFGIQSMAGIKLSLDGERNVSWFNYALHMDYEIYPDFFPLVEFNAFMPLIKDARQNSLDFEGLDLVSSGGNNPKSVITFASGARYRINKTLMAGLVYEVPLTHNKDILDWRVTADLIFYY